MTNSTEPGYDDRADLHRRLLGMNEHRNRYGEFLIGTQWYATPAMFELIPEALRLLLAADSTASELRSVANPAKWLFLDVEATGFAYGAGTLPFLVGLAWWDGGGMQIEQLFMRDPTEEYPVLLHLARRIRERPVLATFNGKSFDWPLLSTRFRMTQTIRPPEIGAHLDFLHPARQIWRLQTGTARLSALEEQVLTDQELGFSRQGDVDSAQIPGVYFDYLSGNSTARLEDVLRHNRMDLRGLAAISARILSLLSLAGDGETEKPTALELFGLSRIFQRRGERTTALLLCDRAIELGLPEPIRETAEAELAKLRRHAQRLAKAQEKHGKKLRRSRVRNRCG